MPGTPTCCERLPTAPSGSRSTFSNGGLTRTGRCRPHADVAFGGRTHVSDMPSEH